MQPNIREPEAEQSSGAALREINFNIGEFGVAQPMAHRWTGIELLARPIDRTIRLTQTFLFLNLEF